MSPDLNYYIILNILIYNILYNIVLELYGLFFYIFADTVTNKINKTSKSIV